MGDIAAWLQSWWSSLSDGTRDQVIGGLILAFIVGAISFSVKVLTAIGHHIRRNPSTQPSQQEWRSTQTARDEQQQRRDLSVMRKAVRRIWIEDVLNKSLYKEVLIQLNMAERPDAVDNRPWNLMLQQLDEASRMLPPNTRIIDVFDKMGQHLLILGEPGSGKTTTLLELARELLDRADQDPNQPTPVVFNLSTWALRRLSLDEWLVDELRTRYNIHRNIAQNWIRHDDLILLLDGLDEVQEQYRDACITAINEYRQLHLVPLVVCSRTTEYEHLSQQFKFDGAVLLKPLSTEQLQDYFDRAGESLSALRSAIHQDQAFLEMAESPLLLSIMTLAYQGASSAKISAPDFTHTRRQHLFDTYITRMFVRRELNSSFLSIKTLGWLRWLAQQMMKLSQSTFFIEGMTPRWFGVRNRWIENLLIKIWSLVNGVLLGALLGLFMGAVDFSYGYIHSNLFLGLLGGILGGFYSSLQGNIFKEESDAYTEKTFQIRLFSSIYYFAVFGTIKFLDSVSNWVSIPYVDISRTLYNVLLWGMISAIIGSQRQVFFSSLSKKFKTIFRKQPYIWDYQRNYSRLIKLFRNSFFI